MSNKEYNITHTQMGGGELKEDVGGGSTTLTPATASTLGGVKIGNGISVTEDGTISAEGGAGGDVIDYIAIIDMYDSTHYLYESLNASTTGKKTTYTGMENYSDLPAGSIIVLKRTNGVVDMENMYEITDYWNKISYVYLPVFVKNGSTWAQIANLIPAIDLGTGPSAQATQMFTGASTNVVSNTLVVFAEDSVLINGSKVELDIGESDTE